MTVYLSKGGPNRGRGEKDRYVSVSVLFRFSLRLGQIWS